MRTWIPKTKSMMVTQINEKEVKSKNKKYNTKKIRQVGKIIVRTTNLKDIYSTTIPVIQVKKTILW